MDIDSKHQPVKIRRPLAENNVLLNGAFNPPKEPAKSLQNQSRPDSTQIYQQVQTKAIPSKHNINLIQSNFSKSKDIPINYNFIYFNWRIRDSSKIQSK